MKYLVKSKGIMEILSALSLEDAEDWSRKWICRTFADRPEATLYELREVSRLSFVVQATRELKEVKR